MQSGESKVRENKVEEEVGVVKVKKVIGGIFILFISIQLWAEESIKAVFHKGREVRIDLPQCKDKVLTQKIKGLKEGKHHIPFQSYVLLKSYNPKMLTYDVVESYATYRKYNETPLDCIYSEEIPGQVKPEELLNSVDVEDVNFCDIYKALKMKKGPSSLISEFEEPFVFKIKKDLPLYSLEELGKEKRNSSAEIKKIKKKFVQSLKDKKTAFAKKCLQKKETKKVEKKEKTASK